MASSSDNPPLEAFLEQYWKDREAGSVRSVRAYLDQFPGDDDGIAAEFSALQRDVDPSPSLADDSSIGPYRTISELGRGGQGVVYLAEDTRLHRKVALKVLTGLGPGSENTVNRFRREAEVASKLEHPGICGVHDAGIVQGVPYIAMQYVEGATLAERISESKKEATTGEPSSVMLFSETTEAEPEQPKDTQSTTTSTLTKREIQDILQVFEKAARALHAAHEVGIVHRDIKPGNIMVTPDGEAVILDFGLARAEDMDLQTLTRTGDLFGTPAYMSPEQLMGHRIRLDRRTDVYSLAASLFECLTLKRPFEAPTREALYQAIMTREAPDLRKLNPHVPPDLSVVLATALEKDRDRRYQTGLELAEELRRVQHFEPIVARPAGPIIRLRRWAQRSPATAAAVTAVFLLLITVVAVLFVKNRQVQEAFAEKTAALTKESTALKNERAALADFDRMADVKRLQEAEATADALWPARPEKVESLDAWLAKYAGLADELDRHRATLSALESQALPYSDADRQSDHGEALTEISSLAARKIEIDALLDGDIKRREEARLDDELTGIEGKLDSLRQQVARRKTWRFEGEQADLMAWKREVLAELVADLEEFAADGGTLASVRSRLRRARDIERLTVTAHRTAWDAATARIENHSKYGFTLEPQTGLIPLGPDPVSKLEEFLHFDTHTGPLPERDASGKIAVTGELGVILVLIPPGRFWMGAQEDPQHMNYHPGARPDETLREVTVPSAFLLSKYEMTQGQWARTPASEPRPSTYSTGFTALGRQPEVDDRHPVEGLSWNDCTSILGRVGLVLPSEEQWEYAARAGTSTIWPGTSVLSEIPQHGNIAGSETTGTGWAAEAKLTDDWIVHAPVGELRANGFGLYDVLGNVWEWTSSTWRPLPDKPEPKRVYRGGGFSDVARGARVATRNHDSPARRLINAGVRPSRIITD